MWPFNKKGEILISEKINDDLMKKISDVLKEYSAIEKGTFFDANGPFQIDIKAFQVGIHDITITVNTEEGISISGNKKLIKEIVEKINT